MRAGHHQARGSHSANVFILIIEDMVNRAPALDPCNPSGTLATQLEPGTPPAHELTCLRLLPSGPDRVHKRSLRRTQLSTLLASAKPHISITSDRNSTSLQRIASYRAPLPPHLARQGQVYYIQIQSASDGCFYRRSVPQVSYVPYPNPQPSHAHHISGSWLAGAPEPPHECCLVPYPSRCRLRAASHSAHRR